MTRMIYPLIALMCLLISADLLAVPQPRVVPARPELSFTPGPLRIYRSGIDGNWYWYMTYNLENTTGVDQIWVPSMVLFTDQGEILQGGRGVPSAVTDEIMARLGDPLLEPQYSMIGEIKQGQGNARSGMTIWPAQETDVNEISLFVAGLSGETVAVPHPMTGEDVILRKTLKRDYQIPGAAIARGDRPLAIHPDMPDREVWIFR